MATDIANFIARNQPSFARAPIDREIYGNALARNEVQRIPQANRAQDAAIQRVELGNSDIQRQNAAGILGRNFAIAANSPRPREAMRAFLASPDFVQAGRLAGLPVEQFTITDADTDDGIRQQAQSWANALSGNTQQQRLVGVANPSDFTPASLAQYQQTGNPSVLVPVEKNTVNRVNPRDYTPESLAAYMQSGNLGDLVRVAPLQARDNPAGGTDVFDPITGTYRTPARTPEQGTQQAANRAQAVSRAEATGGAQGGIKSVRAQAAIRRLDRVKAASEALSVGGPIVGGASGLTPKGQELNQANAQLITELTALTRVPGVGAQSDLEQRLAQLQLPTPEMYPSVRANAIAELEVFMRDLDAALSSVGGAAGGAQAMPDLSQMSDQQLLQIINGQ